MGAAIRAEAEQSYLLTREERHYLLMLLEAIREEVPTTRLHARVMDKVYDWPVAD